MPLRGEMSRTSGVRDPPLYLLNSMNKMLRERECVCVCVCVCEWTSGTDCSVREVKQINTDSNVKCFV